MGKFRSLVAVVTVALAAMATVAARADVYRGYRFASGEWKGNAFGDGKFSHCAMSGKYKSGITLFFSIADDWTWQIGWSSPDWNFRGDRVEVYYRIDGFPVRKAPARVVERDFITAELPANTTVFDEFRKGFVLILEVEGRQHRFQLEGTYAALTRLVECVNDNTSVAARREPPGSGREPQSSATQSPSSRPSKTDDRSSVTAEQKIEAIKVVANILAHRKMDGYRILSAAEVKAILPTSQDIGIMWRNEMMFGTLEVIPRSDRQNLDTLPGILISAESKTCKGEFASGFKNDDFSAEVKRIFAVCKEGKDVSSTHYTIVPVDGGLIYLFTSFNLESSNDPNKSEAQTVAEADTALREAVYSVLRK